MIEHQIVLAVVDSKQIKISYVNVDQILEKLVHDLVGNYGQSSCIFG